MHTMKYLFIFFIYLLLLIQNCFAQDGANSNIKTLAKKIIENVITADKEKALLVTDRKMYNAGETVYFKAFLVDSIHNYLRATPKKLYVDYVDERDSAVAQLLLNNANLQTSGRFILPDSLHEGFYWMRAYNKEMLSDNINNITVIPFYVFGAKRSFKHSDVQTQTQDANNKIVLKFYFTILFYEL